MNIKLKLGEVRLLLDKRQPIEQIGSKIQPLAKRANLLFAQLQVGVDYLQWSLPGSDWTAFTKGSDEQKAAVAQIYAERKATMKGALEGSVLKDIIFTIPSDDFIFFRQKGSEWEVALTAWGYEYVDKKQGVEIDTWLKKHNLQKVSVAFSWDGQLLPGIKFKLVGHIRETTADGYMYVDGMLPVGNSYPIETLAGQAFTLTVEKGREKYVFDLTQYFQVEIMVTQDGIPAAEHHCEINFNGRMFPLQTAADGRANLQIAQAHDETGSLAQHQPVCIASCNGENQEQVPTKANDTLRFTFSFKTPEPEIVKEPEPEKPEQPPKPEPKVIEEPKEEEPKEDEPVVKEPEYVYIQLKDYGGCPLPDLPFTLTTKKQGKQALTTDHEGQCMVPKEWFTPKEKMKIHFVVSAEYQQTHDLHDPKDKKNKKK